MSFRGWMLTAILCTVVADSEARGQLMTSADAGFGHDSNVGNGLRAEEQHESRFFTGAAHLDYLHRPSLYTTLLARGSVQLEQYGAFDKLSNRKGSLLVRAFHRPDGGFFVPTLAGWASVALWDFDSAIRDSTEYRAGAYLLQQLTTAVSARLSMSETLRESDSEVFDLRNRMLGASFDWQLTPRAAVYLGYQHHEGDIVATGAPTYYPAVSHAEAVEADDAFGGFDTDQFAYRLDARTGIAELGFNVRLTPSVSLDLQGLQARAHGDGGTTYERWRVISSVLARF